MTLLRFLQVTALLLVPLVAGAQTSADTVRSLDARWAAAYGAHDTAFALAAMSATFTMTATNGSRKDRATELGDVRPSAGLTVHYFRSADVDVRVHGNAAVVTGRLEWSTTYNGRSSDIRRRYTATWVRGGPLGWQLVALHVGNSP